eukprot:361284-Chlamydomonas_euryale.AAC.4
MGESGGLQEPKAPSQRSFDRLPELKQPELPSSGTVGIDRTSSMHVAQLMPHTYINADVASPGHVKLQECRNTPATSSPQHSRNAPGSGTVLPKRQWYFTAYRLAPLRHASLSAAQHLAVFVIAAVAVLVVASLAGRTRPRHDVAAVQLQQQVAQVWAVCQRLQVRCAHHCRALQSVERGGKHGRDATGTKASAATAAAGAAAAAAAASRAKSSAARSSSSSNSSKDNFL